MYVCTCIQILPFFSPVDMKSYLLAMSVAAGVSILAVFVYLALRLYRKKRGKEGGGKNSLSLPRIVLTSSSPRGHKKRLYPPTGERAASKEKEERLASMRKKEQRREVKSMWLPKRKESLPSMKATLVQPTRKAYSQVSLHVPLSLSVSYDCLCLFECRSVCLSEGRSE